MLEWQMTPTCFQSTRLGVPIKRNDQSADGSGSLTFPCRSVFSSMMAQVRVWTLSVGQSDRQRGQTGRTGERGQVGLTVPSLVRLSELHCLYLLEK